MKNNATFMKRLLAYILDVIIVGIISAVISSPFIDTSNYEKLNQESNELTQQYMKGELKPTTYISKNSDINYDISRETGLQTIIALAIYMVYFIIYQFYNNGQTLGKKLLKIKVISNNKKDLSINQVAIRSLIVDTILIQMLMFILTLSGSKDIYFVGSIVFQSIDVIIMFAIAIMVLSRNDKMGLHDVIAHTRVINVE